MATIDEAVVEQAIAWMVRLQSSGFDTREREACQRWRNAHPDHERVWTRLETLGERFRSIPAPLAHATLDRPASHSLGRRGALKMIAVLLGGALLARGELDQPQPSFGGEQNFRTAPGERRQLMLMDGTRASLNTDTLVEASFDRSLRRLNLVRGELLLTTAPDPASPRRPFVVDTGHGRVRALGTRFVVRRENGISRVAVFEGAVEIQLPDGVTRLRLDPGQQVRFSATAIAAVEAAHIDSTAWVDGFLIARQMSLAELVAELARYRPGLRCDPAVAGLHISGTFPLDDIDRVLLAVEHTLPVRLERKDATALVLRPR